VITKPFKSADAARAYLTKWYNETKGGFITATLTMVGLESLLVNQIHNVQGIGAKLSGNYLFSDITHTLSADGFFTEVNARKVVGPMIDATEGIPIDFSELGDAEEVDSEIPANAELITF
jgi:hypothetical protein